MGENALPQSLPVLFVFKGDLTVTGCNKFKCMYQDEGDACEALDAECIGDLCELWQDCENCDRADECGKYNSFGGNQS